MPRKKEPGRSRKPTSTVRSSLSTRSSASSSPPSNTDLPLDSKLERIRPELSDLRPLTIMETSLPRSELEPLWPDVDGGELIWVTPRPSLKDPEPQPRQCRFRDLAKLLDCPDWTETVLAPFALAERWKNLSANRKPPPRNRVFEDGSLEALPWEEVCKDRALIYSAIHIKWIEEIKGYGIFKRPGIAIPKNTVLLFGGEMKDLGSDYLLNLVALDICQKQRGGIYEIVFVGGGSSSGKINLSQEAANEVKMRLLIDPYHYRSVASLTNSLPSRKSLAPPLRGQYCEATFGSIGIRIGALNGKAMIALRDIRAEECLQLGYDYPIPSERIFFDPNGLTPKTTPLPSRKDEVGFFDRRRFRRALLGAIIGSTCGPLGAIAGAAAVTGISYAAERGASSCCRKK